jgi:hypothetical protein
MRSMCWVRMLHEAELLWEQPLTGVAAWLSICIVIRCSSAWLIEKAEKHMNFPFVKRDMAWDVAKVVECLPNKHKALSSNPYLKKKKNP